MSARVLLVALACAVAAPAAPAWGAPPRLPDLVSEPVTRPIIETNQVDGQTRLLLRFDGFIHNAGSGPLELRGSSPVAPTGPMAIATQRVYEGDPVTPPAVRDFTDHLLNGASLRFESSDGHSHWHLRHAAMYSLWNAAGAGMVAPGSKVGFCLVDSMWTGPAPFAPAAYGIAGDDNCQPSNPGASAVAMGLSPGYKDFYGREVWWQWVDISDVQPGQYRIRAEVDPDDLIEESDEVNVSTDVHYRLPGYNAKPVSRQDVPRGTGTVIELPADAVQPETPSAGDPPRPLRAPRFTIESGPQHGTIQMIDATHARYTPAPRDPAITDSFTYSVREDASGFPRSPARATATLELDPPLPPDPNPPASIAPPVLTPPALAPAAPERVAISGAPARVVAGTSVQLTASVTNGSAAGLTWSVDGRTGGDARSGRIGATGLYRAPASVPAAGRRITVGARTRSGTTGTVAIRVTAAPAREPAPSAVTARLRSTRLRHSGIFAVASTMPRRSGRLRVTILVGSRALERCTGRAVAGRVFTCRARLQAADRRRALRAVATLRERSGRLTQSRASAAAPHDHHH